MINIYSKQNNSAVVPEKNGPSVPGEKRADFRTYKDPTGEFDSKALQYGMWYVQHAVLLRRLLFGGLIAVGAMLWGYSGWQWGAYLIFGRARDQQLLRELSRPYDYTQFQARYAAEPLLVAETFLLPGGKDTYDAVARVVNPNARYHAEFDYYFVIGDFKTPSHHAFLLPEEEGLIGALGLKSSDLGGGTATAIIENVRWRRVSPRVVADVAAFQAGHLNFLVKDFVFRSQQELGGGAHSIAFTVTNDTAYSYVEPQFYVALRSNGSVVGVLPWRPDQFLTEETKQVDLRSFVSNLAVSEIKLYPAINIYDPAAYLPPPR